MFRVITSVRKRKENFEKIRFWRKYTAVAFRRRAKNSKAKVRRAKFFIKFDLGCVVYKLSSLAHH